MCYWVSQTSNVLLEFLQAPKRPFIALMLENVVMSNMLASTYRELLNFMSYKDAVKGVSYLEQSKEQKLICCYNNDGEVFVGSLQLQRVTMVRLLDVVKGVSYLEQSKEQSFN
ncbi:hypothetical protein L6452_23727 [Arctium lappa]|uniref:Uncharacterized protein n=1 Tax=Arctium lappa TaxID=4217 RepID=A0ACB9A8S9_ARCLA|nr:hypothetical protein L6452_23727 [Arctium lappa]